MPKKKTDIEHVSDEPEKVSKCRICNHPDREGIELVAIMSAASWNIARERVNNTFGTNFTTETVRKHMTEHELHRTAAEQGIILDAMRGKDGAPAVISSETLLQTLLVQGMLDLAKGKIRAKTPQDLIAIVNTLQNIQTRKEARMAVEGGNIEGFYAVMAAYGEAIKDTVSHNQLMEIVAKANALGATFDIGNTRFEPPIEVDPADVMVQAVEDYKQLGTSRTRDELIEAGVIDDIEAGLDLPD